MKEISFPYGKTKMTYAFDENELAGVLVYTTTFPKRAKLNL